MIRNDHHLSELKAQIFDIFMELDSENQEAEKKAANDRYLHARRSIEQLYEKRQLKKALVEYEFD